MVGQGKHSSLEVLNPAVKEEMSNRYSSDFSHKEAQQRTDCLYKNIKPRLAYRHRLNLKNKPKLIINKENIEHRQEMHPEGFWRAKVRHFN